MKIHSLFVLKDTGECIYKNSFSKELQNLNVSFSEKVIDRDLEELEMGDLRFSFKREKGFIFVLLADTSVSLLFLNTRIDKIMRVFFQFYDKIKTRLKDLETIENEEFDGKIDEIITGKKEKFEGGAFYGKIINMFEELIFKNEIIGAAILSTQGNIIYSSLPNEILLSSLKELEIRFMTHTLNLPELFYSLPDEKKVFSKMINFDNYSFLMVLLFDKNVSLGMADIQLHKIAKKIKQS
ncbi:MAG: hypothetical protein ACOCT9_02875 [archaeon]